MPHALHVFAILSLLTGAVCALIIAFDERGRQQHMWIMNVVWPVCALFGGLLVLCMYLRFGRGSRHSNHASHNHHDHHDDHDHHEMASPFPVSVAKSSLHCGGGCTLGDIIAEWLAFLVPSIAVVFGWHWIFAEKIFAVWVLDFVLAFGFGVAFQYFAIKPMRDITVREGIVQALKADAASLISWQVGMYGFMAIAHFRLFPKVIGSELTTNSVEFWFMMQIAMLSGFVTSYPVNWLLLRMGVKDAM